MRQLALAGGVKRLAVRSRPGTDGDELVVAYPWRNSARAEVLAEGLAAVLDAIGDGDGADFAAVLEQAAERLAATPPGSAPRLIKPRIPVVAITGTNGKTTTSRMLGFIAQRAGLSVGWSSTDGVYLNGELVEAGDYSGPSGAGQVLRQPGVQLAVTETARGGILRRGVGVAWNDVSVVTNISADHLGLGGIETLDQLAEVKAVITKITRPTGWCVLNADDPRTFAMRLGTKARIWVFTTRPELAGGACGDRRPRAGDHGVRRLGGRAAARRPTRFRSCRCRRADDPGRTEPGERREHARRDVGGAGRRTERWSRWPTGCGSSTRGLTTRAG